MLRHAIRRKEESAKGPLPPRPVHLGLYLVLEEAILVLPRQGPRKGWKVVGATKAQRRVRQHSGYQTVLVGTLRDLPVLTGTLENLKTILSRGISW